MNLSEGKKNNVAMFLWLKNILYIWVKSICLPSEKREDLQIDPNKPVCYVFRAQSYTDLLVLDKNCSRLGIPRPEYKIEELKDPIHGSYIHLDKSGLLQRKSNKDAPSELYKLVEMVNQNRDIQIVPVSVFWGRSPGTEERSMLKLLFFDDQYGGFFQKFIRVFVHGRDVICNFGTPISVKEMLGEGLGVEQTTKKLRRVLKVHFRSLRISTLGPYIYDQAQVTTSILNSKRVRETIKEEATRKKTTEDKIKAKAIKYITEVSSKKTMTYIRVASIIFTWLWNKIYKGVEVKHANKLQSLADGGHEIVYVPCHRSHLDYLLITYTIHQLGHVSPHIAAGINLNFWPIGGVLRRMGAFFLRRSFRGNKLYSVVFNEYVHFLLTKGYSLKFFIEGGRSRTGRLKKPMTGMLSMVVKSYLINHERPIVFVPVYIGYDKVLETGSYLKELRGKAKQSESMGQLVKSLSILKSNFGKVYVGFGDPIYMEEFLDNQVDDWRENTEWYLNNTNKLPLIGELADRIMIEINKSAVVSPSSLFSIALLSSPKKAIAECDLIRYVDLMKKYVRELPYSNNTSISDMETKDQLIYLEDILGLKRFSHPDGDVIYLDEISSIYLTYYRNNALHIFVTPSVIAAFFLHNDQVEMDELRVSCKAVFPYLKDELYLHWDSSDFDHQIEETVNFMVENGLLSRKGELLQRPVMTSPEFAELNLMGRTLGRIIERYAVFAAVLSKYIETDEFSRSDIESKCQQMAHKIAILNGTNDPDFFDRELFRNHIQLLISMNIIESADDGKLKINPVLTKMTEKSMSLLSLDVRQSIYKETNWSKEI